MRSPHRDLVRIVFELDPNDWHGSATERLWAEPLGEARYRLRNVPFFAFDVSNEDVVFGKKRDAQIYYTGVSVRGGHSTYRLKLLPGTGASSFLANWEKLARLGCSYEEGRVIAIDVPPNADIHAVYAELEAGLEASVWDFEEGHCGHPIKP